MLITAFTLFLSAALLFWSEPMFSKAALPVLGGVPSVWNTCLVCYQATLLAGYLYAHLGAKWLRPRTQAALHLLLIFGAIFMMPPMLLSAETSPQSPAQWLFWRFLTTIGLPFFLLSATAPMLQAWWAQSQAVSGETAYQWYAVSNFGSLLALFSYPLLLEPLLPLQAQYLAWRRGFGVFAALIFVAAARTCFRSNAARPLAVSPQTPPIPFSRRARWLLLALIPSSLLLGATSHITTDIAAIPLFWVVPLALYLLSFMLVFARASNASRWHDALLQAQALLALPLILGAFAGLRVNAWLDFPLHLTAFFVMAMVCHGELALRKPPAERLTEFYLWMAAGGCLGGAFAALIAPVIFHAAWEYPLMMALSCVMRPAPKTPVSKGNLRRFCFGGLAALALLPISFAMPTPQMTATVGIVSFLALTAFLGVISLACLTTPRRMAAGFVSLLLIAGMLLRVQHHGEFRQRNFFGVMRVMPSPDGQFHLFYHGTTLHGAQRISPNGAAEPLTYFHRDGPLGQMFAALAAQPPRAIGVFGLGVGTMAAYARPGDRLTFYEIDPDVEAIARDTRWFRYLADCPAPVNIVTGDARISLAAAPDQAYDLLIQDAFSSDTIPMHLLTREAFALYAQKARTDGLFVFNITNRHLDLEPLLAEMFSESGLSARIWRDARRSPERDASRKYPSTWVIAAQDAASLAPFMQDERWKPLRRRPGMRVWTDAYSNMFSVLKWPGR